MKYCILTTPRTGSTMITAMMYNLASQWWGAKNNLREYFTFTPFYTRTWDVVNGVIESTSFVKGSDVHAKINKDYVNEERLKRLGLLLQDSNYTFKVFPYDLTPEIFNFIKDNYHIIYLERRDKISQMLSFMNLTTINVPHYTADSDTIKSYTYDRHYAGILMDVIDKYYNIKNVTPGKTLYYEDFMAYGANEDALIRLLDLPQQPYTPLEWGYIPTPYAGDRTTMISNNELWQQDLPGIMARLNKYIT